jgi:hypothetical protein
MKRILALIIVLLVIGIVVLQVTIYLQKPRDQDATASLPRVTPIAAKSAATTVYIDSSAKNVQVDDDITFTVAMDTQNNVTGATLHFTFNPSVIEITSIVPGSFLQNELGKKIDPTGAITYSVGTLKPTPGRGTIAIITARALSPASTGMPLLHIEASSVVLELKNNQSVLKSTSDAYVTID